MEVAFQLVYLSGYISHKINGKQLHAKKKKNLFVNFLSDNSHPKAVNQPINKSLICSRLIIQDQLSACQESHWVQTFCILLLVSEGLKHALVESLFALFLNLCFSVVDHTQEDLETLFPVAVPMWNFQRSLLMPLFLILSSYSDPSCFWSKTQINILVFFFFTFSLSLSSPFFCAWRKRTFLQSILLSTNRYYKTRNQSQEKNGKNHKWLNNTQLNNQWILKEIKNT